MRSVLPSHAWTANSLYWLDTREPSQFFEARFEQAYLWHLPSHPDCLNQLPSRELPLGLIAEAEQLARYQAWLAGKSYDLQACLTPTQFNQLDPKFWPKVSGWQPKRLWQANAFLMTQVADSSLFNPTLCWRALDLGCGGGREAVALAQLGWQVVGVDNQPPALRCARDLALAEQVAVDFRLADLTKPCERPSETFDLIYQLRFLDRSLFDYIEAQLKPGGYVLIETFAEGVQAFGSPKNPKFILQPGELAQRFAHFDIIVDKLGALPDGRPMNAFLARKPAYKSRSEYDESKKQ